MAHDIAVVTGASGGIGKAIAKLLSEKSEGNLRIGIHYRGNAEAALALHSEIKNSFLIQADLSTVSGRSALLEAALKEGNPYVLINNAGIDRPHEPALNVQEESIDLIPSKHLTTPPCITNMLLTIVCNHRPERRAMASRRFVSSIATINRGCPCGIP